MTSPLALSSYAGPKISLREPLVRPPLSTVSFYLKYKNLRYSLLVTRTMMRKPCTWATGVVLLCLLLAGCGANAGNEAATSAQPATPNVTVSLSPTSVTLAQGAINDKVQVSVTAQNGFAGSVSVTTAGLTSGVTSHSRPASVVLGMWRCQKTVFENRVSLGLDLLTLFLRTF
jgi:hypothetical protein